MISFNHGDKSYSLGPSAILEDDLISDNSEKGTVEKDNKNNIKNDVESRHVNIDGIPHSLFETPSTKLINQLDDGKFIIISSYNL